MVQYVQNMSEGNVNKSLQMEFKRTIFSTTFCISYSSMQELLPETDF